MVEIDSAGTGDDRDNMAATPQQGRVEANTSQGTLRVGTEMKKG